MFIYVRLCFSWSRVMNNSQLWCVDMFTSSVSITLLRGMECFNKYSLRSFLQCKVSWRFHLVMCWLSAEDQTYK